MIKFNKIQPAPTIVFIHIPRTGGTTFHELAAKQYGREQVRQFTRADMEAWAQTKDNCAAPWRFVSGHIGFEFDRIITQPHVYITFLRNPVTRIPSVYEYIRTNPAHTHHATVTSQNLSLQEFIERGVSVANIDNGMTRLLCGLPNSAREVGFGECTRAMLEAAKKNLRQRIAVVGLTEYFDASLVLMRRCLDWSSPLYTILNSTTTSRAKTVTPAEVRLIEKYNVLDCELYAYARTLFQRQASRLDPLFRLRVGYFQYKNRVRTQNPKAFMRLRRFESKRIARWLDLT